MRTKGSLNRRTLAALAEAESGKLEKGAKNTISYLLRVVGDTRKEDSVRMRAADVLLPYLRPKLSAIEQTNIDPRDAIPESEHMAALQAIVAQHPELLAQLNDMAKEVSLMETKTEGKT